MPYAPSIVLHHIYSIKFTDSIEVMIESLDSIDLNVKFESDYIRLVPNMLHINFNDRTLMIKGNTLSRGKWILSNSSLESSIVPFTCDKQQIVDTIAYLYHIIKNNTN